VGLCLLGGIADFVVKDSMKQNKKETTEYLTGWLTTGGPNLIRID